MREILDVKSLRKNSDTAIALISPLLVFTDRADTCEKIDISHDLGVHDPGDLIERDFVPVAIEPHLIRDYEQVDAGSCLFIQAGISEALIAIRGDIDITQRACSIAEALCWVR